MLGGGRGSLLLKLKSLFLHKTEAAKPIASLPDELYIEIFIRFPAKSTFTCKCVSKTWFSIISKPDFAKLHLNFQINNNSRFILSGYDSKIQASQIYIITKDSLFSTSIFYGEAVVIQHYRTTFADSVRLLGSCNGWVCLQHYNFQATEFLCLWNPTTKEYKRIPDSPYLRSVQWPAYFCYDYKNDDYKLVYAGNTPSFTVYVYTLRSNSWNTLQTKLYSFDNFNGVLVNGALHWITETPSIIVSFDISDESFKEIQLPEEIIERASHMILKVLEGCLCVVLAVSNKAWVVREYGVRESWTKIQDKIADDKDLKWSSRNGECLIYSEGTDLVLYGPKHSSARRMKLGNLEIRGVDNYVESLVSLNTGIYLGRKEVIGTRRRGIWGKTSIRH
ncbi:F-box/kelch-repeat protein At3g06240-like [Papaver somniferum]|uniref:F-box/kelch-repeat protein At3g06240-like n=1 Tax=Papaver somniferum TaxID=3469 RepID=UPI000E6F594B|nr:F-box/kelch-repeat protein At3g06240-like [Papaver somniferum]